MPFVLNDNYHTRVSRYRRRERSGPIGCAIDLTVTPTFPGLAAPAAPTATPSASGGTLAAGTQTYAVSAINVNGETTPSAQASATTTGTTASVSLALVASTGALSYNIYKLVGSALQLLASGVTSLTFVDSGALTPNAAAVAPAINTTQVIPLAVAGQVRAGDMVYQTASGGVAMLTYPANSPMFVGESEDNYPVALGIGQSVLIGMPDNDPHQAFIAVRVNGEFQFKTTPGEVYTPSQALFVGADPQTVTNVSNGTSIGRVCHDQNVVGGAFSSNLTGAIGQDIMVELKSALYP